MAEKNKQAGPNLRSDRLENKALETDVKVVHMEKALQTKFENLKKSYDRLELMHTNVCGQNTKLEAKVLDQGGRIASLTSDLTKAQQELLEKKLMLSKCLPSSSEVGEATHRDMTTSGKTILVSVPKDGHHDLLAEGITRKDCKILVTAQDLRFLAWRSDLIDKANHVIILPDISNIKNKQQGVDVFRDLVRITDHVRMRGPTVCVITPPPPRDDGDRSNWLVFNHLLSTNDKECPGFSYVNIDDFYSGVIEEILDKDDKYLPVTVHKLCKSINSAVIPPKVDPFTEQTTPSVLLPDEPSTSTSVTALPASPRVVAKGVQRISNKRPLPGPDAEVLVVPQDLVSKVINKGETSIRRVQQTSGAKITLEDASRGKETITLAFIEGDEVQIKKAKIELSDCIRLHSEN